MFGAFWSFTRYRDSTAHFGDSSDFKGIFVKISHTKMTKIPLELPK